MAIFSPQMKTILFRMLALIITMVVGALLFMVIEGRAEKDKPKILTLIQIKQNFLASYNVSDKDFELLVEAVRNDIYFSGEEIPWSFGNSLYFCVVVITTIGYGHVVPQTWQGQLFCIFYSLMGIPITAIMLKSVGQYITLGVNCLLLFLEKRVLKREPDNLETKCFIVTLFLMVFMLIIGALFTSSLEGWTVMEGIYFTFVTLSTIGFGDYVFNDGKLVSKSAIRTAFTPFTLIFLILGLGVVSSVLCSISQMIETGGFSCFKRRQDSENIVEERADETTEMSSKVSDIEA